MSAETFPYDVFLSHRAKDKAVVRPLAERLRQDGLKVWPCPPKPPGEGGFDEWALKPGDSIPAKIKAGLEISRSGFQPLAFSLQPLLDAPIKGSLAQFLYINCRPADREQDYAMGLEVCWLPPSPAAALDLTATNGGIKAFPHPQSVGCAYPVFGHSNQKRKMLERQTTPILALKDTR